MDWSCVLYGLCISASFVFSLALIVNPVVGVSVFSTMVCIGFCVFCLVVVFDRFLVVVGVWLILCSLWFVCVCFILDFLS